MLEYPIVLSIICYNQNPRDMYIDSIKAFKKTSLKKRNDFNT